MARLAAAAALGCLLATSALADTASFALTPALGWQKVASAGQSVVLDVGGGSVALSTTTTGAAPISTAGTDLGPGQSVCWTLTADLYALARQVGFGSQIKVTSGVSCPAGQAATSPAPTPVTITTTEVTVPAATSTLLLAASPTRKLVGWVNDSANPCRVAYGVAATATNGEPFDPAAAAGRQGGSRVYENGVVTQQAIYGYCAAGGSFATLDGQ